MRKEAEERKRFRIMWHLNDGKKKFSKLYKTYEEAEAIAKKDKRVYNIQALWTGKSTKKNLRR